MPDFRLRAARQQPLQQPRVEAGQVGGHPTGELVVARDGGGRHQHGQPGGLRHPHRDRRRQVGEPPAHQLRRLVRTAAVEQHLAAQRGHRPGRGRRDRQPQRLLQGRAAEPVALCLIGAQFGGVRPVQQADDVVLGGFGQPFLEQLGGAREVLLGPAEMFVGDAVDEIGVDPQRSGPPGQLGLQPAQVVQGHGQRSGVLLETVHLEGGDQVGQRLRQVAPLLPHQTQVVQQRGDQRGIDAGDGPHLGQRVQQRHLGRVQFAVLPQQVTVQRGHRRPRLGAHAVLGRQPAGLVEQVDRLRRPSPAMPLPRHPAQRPVQPALQVRGQCQVGRGQHHLVGRGIGRRDAVPGQPRQLDQRLHHLVLGSRVTGARRAERLADQLGRGLGLPGGGVHGSSQGLVPVVGHRRPIITEAILRSIATKTSAHTMTATIRAPSPMASTSGSRSTRPRLIEATANMPTGKTIDHRVGT